MPCQLIDEQVTMWRRTQNHHWQGMALPHLVCHMGMLMFLSDRR